MIAFLAPMSLLTTAVLLAMAAGQRGPPFDPSRWRLDMLDEFDGNSLNTSLWTAKTGIHTSQEGEWYLPENVAVHGGRLTLTAKVSADPRKTGGLNYTSGWVDSKDNWAALGGRFEASCGFFIGAGGRSRGLWPAYWLMPQGGSCWPVSGEIDVMESLGGCHTGGMKTCGEQESHWDLHYSKTGACNNDGSIGNFTKPIPLSRHGNLFNESLSTFGVNYDVPGDQMTFYVNETVVGVHSGFNELVDKLHPWYHILNYAVGGPWGGFPDAETVFPTRMECDWVRHFSPQG
ncbi:hypothetical protein FNF27_02144 [Cafeteria roenbergensis]|uniref:GH16 domain-containing protein n=1 Tax=Cafeteria roenbergensis TaxID=33653 RepID=A0A5A8DYN6_CAFRO|nr:hypothetical protein FNF31_01355 [Cafeteria roenbergensis]KAA0170299.1 hypothetical protein FNF28_01527 [Cafeteria roenbergensis]KAA0176448.1 hypothetical protein FNF27_02144 [Cafeteria roenbergensis]